MGIQSIFTRLWDTFQHEVATQYILTDGGSVFSSVGFISRAWINSLAGA